MVKPGELAVTKGMYSVKRNGKVLKELVIGRLAGNNSRFLCDTEGGFLEIDKENLVGLKGLNRVVVSSLGAGVVETYLAAGTAVDSFMAGTSRDIVGRNVKTLPWISAPTKDLVTLAVTVMEG